VFGFVRARSGSSGLRSRSVRVAFGLDSPLRLSDLTAVSSVFVRVFERFFDSFGKRRADRAVRNQFSIFKCQRSYFKRMERRSCHRGTRTKSRITGKGTSFDVFVGRRASGVRRLIFSQREKVTICGGSCNRILNFVVGSLLRILRMDVLLAMSSVSPHNWIWPSEEQCTLNIRLYIDYDNLNTDKKERGILALATKALLAHKMPTTDTTGRCDVRIYGGWYERTVLTRLAQELIAEIGRDFPAVLPVRNENNLTVKLPVSAELARSLEAEPNHHIFNTFRQKSTPRTLKCSEPSSQGCSDAKCPLTCLPSLFEMEQCPQPGCSITLNQLLHRREQKLVDTMIACDMIHASRLRCDLVILISSDDDLLPAVRVSLLNGTPFVRLHPKNYFQFASFPSGGAMFLESKI
jgi:hypothetical protein